MLDKAKSTDTEAMIAALEDLRFDTIVGPAVMRGLDNQSTLGAWVGETALNGRQGTMRNFRYVDGAQYLHPEEEVRAVAQGLSADVPPAAADRGGAT